MKFKKICYNPFRGIKGQEEPGKFEEKETKFVLLYIKTHYKTIVIKMIWYCYNIDKQIGK